MKTQEVQEMEVQEVRGCDQLVAGPNSSPWALADLRHPGGVSVRKSPSRDPRPLLMGAAAASKTWAGESGSTAATALPQLLPAPGQDPKG